jgi:molybdenum cofactor cytidylyltransferase
MAEVAAIVLAAGASSRFRAAAGASGPATKLVATRRGEALVRHVVRAALASSARPVVVVTGFARDEVVAALDALPVAYAHNADFSTGLASSLRTGVAALPGSAAGAVVLLGDMPDVSAAAIDALIEAFQGIPSASAVAPVFDGERGNPVLISRALFPGVAALKGDAGARKLLASRDDVVELPMDDAAVAFDVDTPDALSR